MKYWRSITGVTSGPEDDYALPPLDDAAPQFQFNHTPGSVPVDLLAATAKRCATRDRPSAISRRPGCHRLPGSSR
jgi:hypothetical protein